MHSKNEIIAIKQKNTWDCQIDRSVLKLTYFENELHELEHELKETNVKVSLLNLITIAKMHVQNARFEFESSVKIY